MAVRILPLGPAQGGQATRTVLVGASKARRGSRCLGESARSCCSMHLALQSQWVSSTPVGRWIRCASSGGQT